MKIDVLYGKEGAMSVVISDDVQISFLEANEVFAAPLAQKADIVVPVVKFPQDIDLYQAQKTMPSLP